MKHEYLDTVSMHFGWRAIYIFLKYNIQLVIFIIITDTSTFLLL